MRFLRKSKIWRYRYLLYLAAIAYFGYQAYQKRFGPQPQPVIESDSLGGGKEVLTPDGRKAKLYNVDEFMRLHGVDLEAELKKRESAAQANTSARPDVPDIPASDTQNHVEADKTNGADPKQASDSTRDSSGAAPPSDFAK